MFCTKCGNEMPDGSKFCTKCGAPMGKEAMPGAEALRSASESLAESAAASEKGVDAAVNAAPAPSKKKRAGLVVGVAAAVVVALAAVGIAVANPFAAPAPESEPESVEAPAPEPAPAPESAPAPAAPATEPEPVAAALPEAWFSGVATDGYSIVDESGAEVALSNPDAVVETPFSGGWALGSWETSEYDAEWDQVHDERTHWALFDSSGNAAVNLDAAVAAAGITGRSGLAVGGDMHAYSCERLIVSLSPFEQGQDGVMLVLDEKGSVVFSVGREEGYEHLATIDDDAYHDGVVAISSPSKGSYLADVDGNMLVGDKAIGEIPESLGLGWYVKSITRDAAYAYDGSVAFDAASVNGDGVIDGKVAYEQPGGSGIVAVSAQRENPYGGANKDLRGLYSISAAKWLAPLGEELDAYGDANDGMLWVRTARAAMESADAAGETAAASSDAASGADPSSGSLRSVIMDAEGNVVFDASMADAALGIPEDFCAQYLHDGWWGIRSDGSSEPYALVCIQDGAFLGAIDAPQKLVQYPNSGIYWL